VSPQAEIPTSPTQAVTFNRVGVLEGARRTIPIALSIFTYGIVFGVLAGQAGLSIAESLLMSALVFAGASQFVALDLWVAPLPVLTIVLTTLVVNLRHVLMGASLSPWFSRLPPVAAYTSIFFVNDEGWALTMSEYAKGSRNGAFLLGSGLAGFFAWTGSTLTGQLLGSALQGLTLEELARFGLDFAFPAVLIALLAGLWRGRADLLPWAVAAVVAVVSAQLIPGRWYILLGGLAGSIIGAVRDES
jgi:4-azaleucine resistance transporter AzlC